MFRSIAVQPYAQRVIPPRPGRLFLRARDRRGAAVLIIAMIFLFVLGVMQLGQSFLATQVTDQTAQAIYGNAAQTLADSVIEEVFNWVDTQANQPAKPLFSQVRQELPQAANAFASSGILPASVEIDISEEAYPSARALRALPTLDHYVIEGVSGNLTYDRRLGAFFDQAYSGILTLRAVVSTKLEPAVRRTVERRIGFRVLNLAIPPPLGQATVYYRSPHQLVDGMGYNPVANFTETRRGVEINPLIRTLRDDYGPTFITAHRTFLSSIDAKIAGGQSQIDDAHPITPSDRAKKREAQDKLNFYKAVRREFARMTDGQDPESPGIDHLDTLQKLMALVQPFPDDADKYSLVSDAQSLDLAALNLQQKVINGAKFLNDLLPPIEALEAGGELSLPQYTQLAKMRRDQARMMEYIMEQVLKFREYFAVVEATGATAKAYGDLKAGFAAVEPYQLLNRDSLLGDRLTYVIEEDPQGVPGRRDINQKMGEFFGRIDPGGLGVGGGILVRNNADTLVLKGTSYGRMLLAVTGNVEIEDLKVRSDQDVITIVALGGDLGVVRVSGQVVASLVITGRRVYFDPSTEIVGSLLMWDVNVDQIGGFVGTVRPDPRLQNLAPEMRKFLLSPWSRNEAVERK